MNFPKKKNHHNFQQHFELNFGQVNVGVWSFSIFGKYVDNRIPFK